MRQTQSTRVSWARITEQESASGWSMLLALFFVLAYGILWIAGQILVATLSGSTEPTLGALALGGLLGTVICVAGIFQWARRRMPMHWMDGLRLKQPTNPPLYAVVLFGLGAAWAIDLIGVLLKLKSDQVIPPVFEVLHGPITGTWIAAAILAIIVQPIAEGLIFDGLLYPVLARDTSNNLVACFMVAAFYALLNALVLNTNGGTWYLLLQPFLMAFVVALVRAYTQSTQSAIVARALFGLFFVLAALISLRF